MCQVETFSTRFVCDDNSKAGVELRLDAARTSAYATVRPVQAGTFQIVGAVLDVRAKLLFYFGVHLRTPEDSGDAGAKRIEEFHISSGCAESAEAMADTSRFQLSVS